MKDKKFSLGEVVTTATISVRLNNLNFLKFMHNSLNRHQLTDWGELEQEDKEANDFALENADRLFSSYLIPKDTGMEEQKIWIITEHDRSYTTILFPSDY